MNCWFKQSHQNLDPSARRALTSLGASDLMSRWLNALFLFPLIEKWLLTDRQTAPNLHFRCLDRLHRKVNPGASGVWPISDLGDISPARWDAPPATPPRLSYLDRFRSCRYIPLFLLLLCTVAKKSWYNFHSFPFLCWLSESLTSFVAIWICKRVWGWWAPARLGHCGAPRKRGHCWKMPF